MKRIFSSPSRSTSRVGFKVVVVYDDTAAGLRAKDAYDRMAQQIGSDCEFELLAWEAELLEQDPLLAEVAAVRAADADMVIISLHDGRQSSRPLRGWIKRWINRRSGPQPALVQRFGNPAELNNILAQTFLRNVAHRAGKEVFYQAANGVEQENIAIGLPR